jgi:hypothetical protein
MDMTMSSIRPTRVEVVTSGQWCVNQSVKIVHLAWVGVSFGLAALLTLVFDRASKQVKIINRQR